MQTDGAKARASFLQFAQHVARRLGPAIVGNEVVALGVLEADDGRTGGWYCSLLAVRNDPETTIELWFDRYLDPKGPRQLSCWAHGTKQVIADVASRAEHAPGWGPATVFDRGDRNPDRRSLLNVPDAIVLASPMLDCWPKKYGDYFGKFLFSRSAVVLDAAAMDAVVSDIAQLVDFVADVDTKPVEGGAVGDDDSDGSPPDERALRAITIRRGQRKFRDMLLRRFQRRCVVSNSGIVSLLEAAHIVPHADAGTYELNNGILLRADLHTLFDFGLMSFVLLDGHVVVAFAEHVRREEQYRSLHGRRITAPLTDGQRAALLERGARPLVDFGAYGRMGSED